jgi:CRP-like cAMP-binding protein
MVIQEDILYSVGASIKIYEPSEVIFNEGDIANYYYQIISGEVKQNNYNDEGKETIQIILQDGQSIGESLLFMDKPYPFNAVAIKKCEILRLPKYIFLDLLKLYPEICLDMNKLLSQRLYFKLLMSQNPSSQNPTAKLKTLMDYLKSFQEEQSPYSFVIPLTRQQMAGLTGLCVETAIRTIKIMEKDKILKIKNRKILY